jgi:hypothetical protein
MPIPVVNSQVDVAIPNCTVMELNSDNTWILIQLPLTDPLNPTQLWLPIDSRVTLTQSLPAMWPPIEGDEWTVTGTTIQAFVVGTSTGSLYFCTPDNIRTLAQPGGSKSLPLTTDQALSQYGSQLALLYRKA